MVPWLKEVLPQRGEVGRGDRGKLEWGVASMLETTAGELRQAQGTGDGALMVSSTLTVPL